jgi:hypothetical protein
MKRWGAVHALPEADRMRAEEIYVAADGVLRGATPDAFDVLFKNDVAEYSRIATALMDRDGSLRRRIEDHSGMRDWFSHDPASILCRSGNGPDIVLDHGSASQ